MVCSRQRLSSLGLGDAAEHKVGFWVGLCGRHQLVLTGTLGEGPARFFERELFFAWFLLGITCLGVLAPVLVA